MQPSCNCATATTPIINPTGLPVALGQPIARSGATVATGRDHSRPQWMMSRREQREAGMLSSVQPTQFFQGAGAILPQPTVPSTHPMTPASMAVLPRPQVPTPTQAAPGVVQVGNSCSACLAHPQPQPQPQQQYVAMMLRPVPLVPLSNPVEPPIINTAMGVQQASASAPPLADPAVRQASDQSPPTLILTPPPGQGEPGEFASPPPLPTGPQVVSTLAPAQQVTDAPPLPMAPVQPLTVAMTAQDRAGADEKPQPELKKPAPGDTSPRSSTLPPPRIKNAEKKAPATAAAPTNQAGWPDIPAPMITNPPHAPREFQKHALSTYIIEPPDVLRIDGSLRVVGTRNLPIEGPHLVRPDGTIGLGTYGAVFVAGMTIDQAKAAIIQTIMRVQEESRAEEEKEKEKTRNKGKDADNAGDEGPLTTPSFQDFWRGIRVDVAAYNSKFYYVITDGGGYGETVIRLPITGNETVLDAISQIQGLPAVASKKKIWVARATPHDQHPNILPVDWYSVTQGGHAKTNYQLFPGDRLYVNSDCRIRIDSHLAKFISPIERLLGVTLLGATTVNAIKGNQGF
ncbi:MAG: hypothetical protein U0840_27935 [Gemmataceae bacterium]